MQEEEEDDINEEEEVIVNGTSNSADKKRQLWWKAHQKTEDRNVISSLQHFHTGFLNEVPYAVVSRELFIIKN